HAIAEPAHGIRKFYWFGEHGTASIELLSEHIGRKGDRAARMLFFSKPIKVGSEADLSLDFFLAIPVIVIGDDRHHDAAMVPANQLERAAIVVLLIRVSPTHALSALTVGSFVVMRQAEIFLFPAQQMRGQDDTTGV